ncbi:M43 family zinc metalloprotease [Hymenobacter ruricola]|uniref:T9SS type A sorting domain-containing protein n=1 Tax=Hymenobacter ruricola TaxID=2791023 RepID=A0ABS0I7Z9_9BACT|nr:M43 family zinc metalloprotease [Hymenobacter ruricola]MBF9222692.1 T9SS type A sorting domain-containing protein [Hymenobacter ruricola]
MRFFLLLLRFCGCWLLGAAALFGSADALAQTSTTSFSCGFDRLQQAAFARQPGSKAAYEQFLAQAARLAGQQRSSLGAAPDVTVPVVVHIMFSSTGGTSAGITDAQVADALRVVNLDFSKTNPDTAAVIPAFQARVANVGFRFRLAQLDPNGNCTTGITRTFSATATAQSGNDDLLKRQVRWDPARYLNIWVVEGINNSLTSLGGYAYLPCTGGTLDGIVILKSLFGTVGAAAGNGFAGRALTHEIGHYFGLSHTWGNTNTPGLPANCGLGDGIADTPTTIGTFTCNLAFTSCADPLTGAPILANVQNYMDYAPCICMFTLGQRAVMRAALALGCRQQLTSAANLAATGTADGYQPPAGGCPAAVAIGVDQRRVCANQSGGPRYFTGFGTSDALNAATATVQWAFPGGVPATSTSRVARVSYPTPGVYAVTLTITPAGGPPVTRTEPQWMQVSGPGTGLAGAVNESFENPAFPNNFGPADLRNWLVDTVNRAVANRWQRAGGGALVAADGTACLVVPNVLVQANQPYYSIITSPALDLSAFQGAGHSARLSFRTARASNPTLSGSGNDVLVVQYGPDCEVYSNVTGQSYTTGSLQVPGQTAQNGFVPTSVQQWTTITLPLDPQYIGPATWLRFQFQSTGGNPFYLDRVRIEDPAAPLATHNETLARPALEVYPNPATRELRLRYPAPGPAPTGLRLYDALGRQVRAFAAPVPDGPLSLQGLAAGVYVLRGELAGHPMSCRVAVAE